MQRVGRASDFSSGPVRPRHPLGAERFARPATGELDPASALLAASAPVQHVPVVGHMRPPRKAAVGNPGATEPGIDAAGAGVGLVGADVTAAGLPEPSADEPVSDTRRPVKPPRSAPAARPILRGVTALLVAAAVVGGYAMLESTPEGGHRTVAAADGTGSTTLVSTDRDAAGTVTPAAEASPPASSSVSTTVPFVRPVADATSGASADAGAGQAAEASAEIEDAEVPGPPLDQESMVRSAQRALIGIGLDPGPVDGLMGRKTRAAATAYQRRIGVAADGEVDAELLQQLAVAVAAKRLSDDDIPPARLPVVPAPAAAVSAKASAAEPGVGDLLAAFHRVFGGSSGDSDSAPESGTDGDRSAGVRR